MCIVCEVLDIVLKQHQISGGKYRMLLSEYCSAELLVTEKLIYAGPKRKQISVLFSKMWMLHMTRNIFSEDLYQHQINATLQTYFV